MLRIGTMKIKRIIMNSRKRKFIFALLGLYDKTKQKPFRFCFYCFLAVRSDRIIYKPMVAASPANPKKTRNMTAAIRIK